MYGASMRTTILLPARGDPERPSDRTLLFPSPFKWPTVLLITEVTELLWYGENTFCS